MCQNKQYVKQSLQDDADKRPQLLTERTMQHTLFTILQIRKYCTRNNDDHS